MSNRSEFSSNYDADTYADAYARTEEGYEGAEEGYFEETASEQGFEPSLQSVERRALEEASFTIDVDEEMTDSPPDEDNEDEANEDEAPADGSGARKVRRNAGILLLCFLLLVVLIGLAAGLGGKKGDNTESNVSKAVTQPESQAMGTVDPTTADPTTADPTTADPTTADPTTTDPTTALPTEPATTDAPIPVTPEGCQNGVASSKTCYLPSEPVTITSTVCAPDDYDWNAIYGEGSEGTGDDFVDWQYICDGNECPEGVVVSSWEQEDLAAGTYYGVVNTWNYETNDAFMNLVKSPVFEVSNACPVDPVTPTLAPVVAPTAHPVDGPTAHPVDPPTTHPVDSPTSHPVDGPTAHPVDPPTTHPVDGPTTHPVDPPTTHPVDGPTAHPVDPPTYYPVAPPTEAPTEAPVEHHYGCGPNNPECLDHFNRGDRA